MKSIEIPNNPHAIKNGILHAHMFLVLCTEYSLAQSLNISSAVKTEKCRSHSHSTLPHAIAPN
jgi:hypothetical protein